MKGVLKQVAGGERKSRCLNFSMSGAFFALFSPLTLTIRGEIGMTFHSTDEKPEAGREVTESTRSQG